MNREIYRMKVLIVDDETKILKAIASKVKKVNPTCHIVATANNGKQALEEVTKHRPHMVLTDIKMPGMDGLELAREIKKRFPSIFVVIISGFSDFSLARQAIQYGVFNYLLKPVDEDQLRDTLEDIQGKMESIMTQSDRSILSPTRGAKATHDSIFQAESYGVFLLCFNNLCHDNLDEQLVAYYRELMEVFHWEKMLQDLQIKKDWMVIDEYTINQKCLLVGLPSYSPHMLQDMAHGMEVYLRRNHPDVMVNICCHKKGIHRDKIWLYTQRMRNILQNGIVLTRPHLFMVERDENKLYADRLYSIKMRIDKHLKGHIKTKNYDKAYGEIREILGYLSKSNMNQKQYEKVVVNILQLFELYLDGYDNLLSEKLQIELFRILHFAKSYEKIQKAVFRCIDNFMSNNQTATKVEDIREEILNYVDKHYMQINKVEDVAGVFNYNYTYLSRLFKKMTGTTMIKYITAKRVETAKKYIQENKDMSLGTISEMVGYTDQHYFSRTFKQMTGMSPSDYRGHVQD